MIRPTTLVETFDNSDDEESHTLSGNLQKQYECGFKCVKDVEFRCLQKYGTLKKFVIVLLCLLLIQSTAQQTFKQITIHDNYYNLPSVFKEWLVLWEGATLILVAVIISYIGGKSHGPSFLSFFSFLQCISYLTLASIILFFSNKSEVTNSNNDSNLCNVSGYQTLSNSKWQWSWEVLAVLFTLQSLFAICYVNTYSLVICYLDDNTKSTTTPSLIGVVLCSMILGNFFSKPLVQFRHLLSTHRITADATWYPIGILLLPLSILIGLFPRRYMGRYDTTRTSREPQNNVRRRRNYYRRENSSMAGSVTRILGTRSVLFLILGSTCVYTVWVNCEPLEETYVTSTFFISESAVAYGLRSPIASLSVVLFGICICIIRPKASRLFALNVFFVLILITFTLINVYLKCDQFSLRNQTTRKKFIFEACNENCHCNKDQIFDPICSSDTKHVYYSSCHAGCNTVNGTMVYSKCKCIPTETASYEYCKYDSCEKKALIFQIIILISVSIIACLALTNLLLFLRCVKRKDRCVGIGVQITISSIIAYFPGKGIYSLLLSGTCILEDSEGCKMHHSIQLSTYLNLLNLCFLFGACGFYCMAWYSTRGVKLFTDNSTADSHESQLQRNSRQLRSSLVLANCYSEQNPFKEYVKSSPLENDIQLDFTLRQSGNEPTNHGVTMRRDGMLTTLL